jgi:hypothetical protein
LYHCHIKCPEDHCVGVAVAEIKMIERWSNLERHHDICQKVMKNAEFNSDL